MPRITTIPETEAPAVPARLDRVERGIADALEALPDGAVLRMEAEADEDLADLRAAVERVALTHGLCVMSWTDGREDYLYVRTRQ